MTNRRSPTNQSQPGLRSALLTGAGRIAGGALGFAARRPGMVLSGALVTAAIGTFSWNVLVTQPNRHPAPLFASAKPVASPVVEPPRRIELAPTPLPVPRPESTGTINRSPGETQGRQSGPTDPIGALLKSDQAARVTAVQKPTVDAKPKADPASKADPSSKTEAKTGTDKAKDDRTAADTKPSKERVAAAQKALVKLGYGPISADGIMGPTTREALERFEKDRKMPVTGSLGSKTLRQLASRSSMTIE